MKSNPAPLGQLVAIRLAMEPLRALMKAQVDMAARAWEAKHQALVAHALRESFSPLEVREYRLQVAADHTLGLDALRLLD
eukprot:5737106-Pyramimonas_sp.AAC.1